MEGCLFVVSTPIGNYRDITLRALDVLAEVDAVIIEEYRQGSTLLKKLGVVEKELILLNEHNEKEDSLIIVEELKQGKRYALISDCGTPVFADPGTELVRLSMENGISVIPVPGPSSLMAAISLSPLPLEEFYFVGFLPRKKEVRYKKLSTLKKLRIPIILMDAPYRLPRLLSEVIEVFGKACLITLAFDLTLATEKVLHGSIEHILKKMIDKKGEFILIVHP
ncbi:MAG: 16S rRNA (cytidine(1402)-2'-O)-methyltransferase [Anaerolineaceae bacterium]|nr:16S rRNA (cytidine(1402)-2'-O)-methyltransferase [Anaerolineaceae bacterium]